MTEQEFYDCRFIQKHMSFYTIVDFYENCRLFKAKMKNMSLNDLYLYKWYVYANINMNTDTKNLVWSYLNSADTIEEVVLHGKLRDLYVQALRKNTRYFDV